jgi:signal transduction histidine kinase
MNSFIRLVLATGVLMAASLGGCVLSAQQAVEPSLAGAAGGGACAEWFGQDGMILQYPWPGNLATMFAGIGLVLVSLIFYVVRLRSSAARLVIAHGANQLLIDALDKMRAAVVIFDSDMKAVHRNCGFEGRFPALVPVLDGGGTLEQAFAAAYERGVFRCDMDAEETGRISGATIRRLRAGKTESAIVQSPAGDTFDLSMFRLGRSYYAAIWVDVTELQRQRERITAQSDALGAKNAQLLAFSAMAAHDLKAPLVQQSALMDFILEDMSGAGLSLPGEVGTYFATFGDLSRRMNLLVGDLLDYAKAESPQAGAECFAPGARLHDVVALAAPNPHLEVVIEAGMPDVKVSPTTFDMVMRNLVGNAAKHHDRLGGRIILRGYRDDGRVVIEVEDDGPGIAPDQHARVFEPFTRLTRVEGTGLGLALVKQAVAGWGGEISLRAAAQRGCIFAVSLPGPEDIPRALEQAAEQAWVVRAPSAVTLDLVARSASG